MEDIIFNSVIKILSKARKCGITVFMENQTVKFKVDSSSIIEDELFDEIKKYKNEIKILLGNGIPQERNLIIKKLSKINREDCQRIPLSFAQERLWFLDQLSGSQQYHVPAVLRLQGELNESALEQALRSIVNRHEVLRTVIEQHQGQAYQRVLEVDQWSLHTEPAAHYSEEHLQAYIQQLTHLPFDLAQDHKLRVNLLRIAEREQLLVVVLHHIASDGWSMPLLVSELVEGYNARVEHRLPQLPELPLQYADYALWQRQYLQGEVLDGQLAYWQQQLEGVIPLNLPTDFVRPAQRSNRGAVAHFQLDRELSQRLQQWSQQQGATLFMGLLSVFKLLLYRYSGQADICVGSSIANREQQEVEGLIGFFVNTLALRTRLQPEMKLSQLVEQVRQSTLSAYQHQQAPFEKVVEAVVKERDMSRNPLFEVMFVLDNASQGQSMELTKVKVLTEDSRLVTAKFDLTLTISITPRGLHLSLTYRTDLYKPSTIERLVGHYRNLLEAAVAGVDLPLSQLPLLSLAEERQLLVDFNQTQVDYPAHLTVVNLFQQQAARTPSAVALVFQDQQLTYHQLDLQSNQLAHYLRSLGVSQQMLVGICLERSLEMVISILAILKAGAAYVPIDPAYPAERIAYMLADSAAPVLISSGEIAHKLAYSGSLVDLVQQGALIQQQSSQGLAGPQADELAYVIYTSGSTGRPKGVMIEHKSLVDYVYGLAQKTSIKECPSFALVSTLAADLGNTVIYSSLLWGGCLHICSKDLVQDGSRLAAYFSYHQIACLKIVPSHWQALASEQTLVLPTQLLVFGGEPLAVSLVEQINKARAGCQLVNHYGPTETTIGKLLYRVDLPAADQQGIPIGQPFGNTQVYVLGQNQQLVPIGATGEIHIGGAGLARGYLNQAELTQQKFIANPFGEGRLYKTGDLGRWLEDGNLEYLGRMDEQVKLRGYRIELGEIEQVLQEHPQLKQCVVVLSPGAQTADGQPGEARLVAYLVSDAAVEMASLREYLLERLPEYMVPSAWVQLESIPLTSNGKVDRQSLTKRPVEAYSGQGYVAPRSELEQALANIWQELLGVEQVSLTDDFFKLGGHSLLAVRLVSAIRKHLHREVDLNQVFDYPILGDLAALLINQSAPSPDANVVRQTRPERIPLSFAQERLWFLDQLSGSQQYHVPAVLRLQGELNESALEQALRSIVNRHEVLRTVIEQHQGQAYQRVLEVDQWSLHTEPAAHYSEEHLQAYIQQLTHLPFDLAQDHKLRVNLLRIAEREQLLVVVLHHIASDGWSMPLLVSELVEGYNARVEHRLPQLPELPLQYADYALWQRQYLQGEVLDGQLAYWQQQLEGVIPLNLPTDFVRPAQRSNRGAVAHFQLDRELSQRLQQWSQQQGATLFMGLLSVFKLLLYRYSGQADICVGSPIANREQQEVEGLIGFFVNTLALRTRLQPEMKLSQLVEQVRQSTLSAYQHQQAPFEKVVEAVVKERDMSRNPLFEVMFILQNNQRVEVDRHSLQGVELQVESLSSGMAKYDITFIVTPLGEGGLSLVVEYTTDLYKPSTIERLVGHYRNLLEAAVAGVDLPLNQLPLLSLAEERQLLVDFNQTQVDYPAHLTVVDLFQQQAARTPSAVALVFQDQQLTYHQLDLQSNQLAHYLRSLGVSQQMLVGICLERSLEMVISILAILKAGAAYVPIDPAYPAERIAYMLADSAAPVLISSGEIAHKLAYSGSLVDLVQQGALIQQQSSQGLAGPQADELAYVIYTSGSTGRPKGVMIEHKSLLNYLLYAQSTYCQQPALQSDSLLLLSYCFDASLTSLFGPLLKGGCLRMAHPATQEQLLPQAELLAGAPYQFLKLTPAHLPLLEALLKESDQLLAHTLVVGGEVLSAAAVTPLLKQGIVRQVINEYGPTEATVGCSTYELPMSGQEPDLAKVHSGGLPIGKPIANGQIHLLDSELRLVPLGVVGEIHIGGAGLARGYLNQAELTQQKFIANPFGEGRLYKTGDLGRWLEDGNLEYLGRMDEQVKLRGYRIELGEIEQVLQEHPQLKQCVVVLSPGAQTADGQPGEARLVAYLVSDAAVEMASLREYLLERLPEYMVPSAWVQLESIPLTSNGKVDRQSLTKRPVEAYSGQGYVAPRSELEQTLANIWQELLGLEQVGIYDNFFELGGHSLLATRVTGSLKAELSLTLPVRALFEFPNIDELSRYLELKIDAKNSQMNVSDHFEMFDI